MSGNQTPPSPPFTLELEPLDADDAKKLAAVTATPVKAATTSERAIFHPNTRAKSDRRVLADRREELRMTPDRRKGDRRPRKTWEGGHNL